MTTTTAATYVACYSVPNTRAPGSRHDGWTRPGWTEYLQEPWNMLLLLLNLAYTNMYLKSYAHPYLSNMRIKNPRNARDDEGGDAGNSVIAVNNPLPLKCCLPLCSLM